MIAAMEQQTAVLKAILGALQRDRPDVPSEQNTTIQLGNFGNSQTSQAKKASPKLEFAIQWLRQHPEHMLIPGRDLEAKVTMNGEPISYKWWNEAKKEVAKP